MGQVWIDSLTFVEAIDEIERLVDAGKGGRSLRPTSITWSRSSTTLHFAQRTTKRVSASSMVNRSIWASHLLGSPLPEKISGSDLILPLMDRAERKAVGVSTWWGSPRSVASLAANKLKKQFDVEFVGIDAPHVSQRRPGGRRRSVARTHS